jgi:hypothetical protein
MAIISRKHRTTKSIWADAKADAVIDKTGKRNHTLEVIQHLGLAAIFLLWYVDYGMMIWTVIGYPFLRAGLFNPLYNHYRDNKFNHLGNNFFDNCLKWALKFEENHRFPMLFMIYFVLAFTGFLMGIAIR